MKSQRPVQLMLPLEFAEPPRTRPTGRPSRYAHIADQLRARPGEWHQIAYRPSPSAASSFARDARRGRPRVLAGMRVKVRRGFEVWACWPGEDEGEGGAS